MKVRSLLPEPIGIEQNKKIDPAVRDASWGSLAAVFDGTLLYYNMIMQAKDREGGFRMVKSETCMVQSKQVSDGRYYTHNRETNIPAISMMQRSISDVDRRWGFLL